MPDSPDADRLRHDLLEEELEAARRKRESYQALLKDLPEVFEGKFRERIRPIQQRNDQLLEEGTALREQIRRALPQAGVSGNASLPPAAETGTSANLGLKPDEVREAAGKPTAAAVLRRVAEGLRSMGMAGAGALAAGLVFGLGALLLATHPWRSGGEGRQAPRPPASAQVPRSNAGPTAQTAATQAAVPSISLRTTGPSWLEVRSSEGVLLFSGELNGQRSFPLRSGLKIRSGRADLVYLRVNRQPERQLGSVDLLAWTAFRPDGPAGEGAERQP